MLGLSLPLTALIAVLATPTALVVFQRGRFTSANAMLLGALISIYAFSLVGSGVQRALLAPFFALLDTRTPLRNTIYGVVANLVLLPVAVGTMAAFGGPAVLGVGVAYSIAQYVNVAHAAYRVRAIAGSPWRGLGPFALKVAIASGLSALAMLPLELWLGLDHPKARLAELAGLIEVAAVGFAVLGGALGLLFVNDIRHWRHAKELRAASTEITGAVPETARREGA
jgi:putative peptidoglycan lipid II flippase